MTDVIATKIRRAAEWASLAPSSHNCQPWSLIGCNQRFYTEHVQPSPVVPFEWRNALVLGIDQTRSLSALLSLKREMRMSVGGFAALFHNFLRLQGIDVAVQLFSQGWAPATAMGAQKFSTCEPLAVFFINEQLISEQPAQLDYLLRLAQQRKTLRGRYRISSVCMLPTDAGSVLPYRLSTDDACTWHKRDQRQDVKRLAEFVARHAERDFSDRRAWAESYRHIDFSERTGEVDDIGFNIQQLLGPMPAWKRAWYRGLLAPVFMPVSVRLGVARRIARQLGDLVAHSAAVYYLTYSPSSIEQSAQAASNGSLVVNPLPGAQGVVRSIADYAERQFLAGESMLALWLAATENGLALHPVSVVLQHDDIRAQLQQLLQVLDEIWFLARVGEPAQTPTISFRYRRAINPFCVFPTTALGDETR
ncbi:MAG: hypothetical protein HY308_10385 [Gammaproteobacteria bacterium]|nr:hypothetical protein [Gammaproteobacteria bacterium]